jgi:hypothetical protein
MHFINQPNKTMKRFFFPLMVIVLVTWMSCKPADEPVVIPTSLFKSVVVKHPVNDYAKFKAVFMTKDSMTAANGLHTIGVARGIQDTNMVAVIAKVDDVAKAKAFFAAPELKAAMDSAGVSAPPTFEYVDVVRNDDSEIPQMERMMIKHHVKDFASWLKVYDKEGKEARAGLWNGRSRYVSRYRGFQHGIPCFRHHRHGESYGARQIRRTQETD